MQIQSYLLSIQIKINQHKKTTNINANQIRGYFSKRYPNFTLLHNHLKNNYIYIYPRIQYRIFDDMIYVLGIEEGIDIVRYIEKNLDNKIILNNNKYKIIEAKGNLRQNNLQAVNKKIFYTFMSPWIALNEKNYKFYRAYKDKFNQKKMLENILFGNIMLLSKNFGYTIDKQVTVNINKFIKTDIVIKNIEMLGFLGNFTINFEIPDYFGIGKAVSKGFGVIARYNKKHIIMEETDNVNE